MDYLEAYTDFFPHMSGSDPPYPVEETLEDSSHSCSTTGSSVSSDATGTTRVCVHDVNSDPSDQNEASQSRVIQPNRSIVENRKRCVRFKDVEVFYFERTQGFLCVPSQGGSTLGMSSKHSTHEVLSVCDHEKLRKLIHYATIVKRFKAGKLSLTPLQYQYIKRHIVSAPRLLHERIFGNISGFSELNMHSQIQEFMLQSDDSRGGSISNIPTSCESPVAAAQEEDLEAQIEGIIECCFLQLLSIKKRRFLLRKAGLTSIDPSERADCQAIRLSREVCGCACPGGNCLPDQCSCALEGIKCQVDRAMFPCACTKVMQCANPVGRIEFDPMRVRAHYLHTRMRLDMQCDATDDAISLPSETVGQVAVDKESHFTGEPCAGEPCVTKKAKGVDGLPFEPSIRSIGDSHSQLASTSFREDLYNSTETGACRDCRNDLYVHSLLLQQQQHHLLSTQMAPFETVVANVPTDRLIPNAPMPGIGADNHMNYDNGPLMVAVGEQKVQYPTAVCYSNVDRIQSMEPQQHCYPAPIYSRELLPSNVMAPIPECSVTDESLAPLQSLPLAGFSHQPPTTTHPVMHLLATAPIGYAGGGTTCSLEPISSIFLPPASTMHSSALSSMGDEPLLQPPLSTIQPSSPPEMIELHPLTSTINAEMTGSPPLPPPPPPVMVAIAVPSSLADDSLESPSRASSPYVETVTA